MFVFFKFTDYSICFILHTAPENSEEKAFSLMKQGISELVRLLCGVRSVNYCVISQKYQPSPFQRTPWFDKKNSFVKEILAFERDTERKPLTRDFFRAEHAFKGQTARRKVCS